MILRGVDRYVTGAEEDRYWQMYPTNVRRAILSKSAKGLPNVGREISISVKALRIPTC